MLTNTWDTNGCAPTDESIENYAVCECEHLTPFGGGMLAPPNVLSFADLVVSMSQIVLVLSIRHKSLFTHLLHFQRDSSKLCLPPHYHMENSISLQHLLDWTIFLRSYSPFFT
jgi:hypothetical protein